jgi:hypothetical protein
MRLQLRMALESGRLPGGTDGGERLLLVFEELVSNGLRHGRPPVGVTVAAVDGGWQLEVSDAAPDQPPTPAVGRDAADGGMGLSMVARISDAHGWAVDGGRKIVWSQVGSMSTSESPLPERLHAATERACGLAVRLTATATRLAATRDELAAQAIAEHRPKDARRHRVAAVRARRMAEQARRAAPGRSASGQGLRRTDRPAHDG